MAGSTHSDVKASYMKVPYPHMRFGKSQVCEWEMRAGGISGAAYLWLTLSAECPQMSFSIQIMSASHRTHNNLITVCMLWIQKSIHLATYKCSISTNMHVSMWISLSALAVEDCIGRGDVLEIENSRGIPPASRLNLFHTHYMWSRLLHLLLFFLMADSYLAGRNVFSTKWSSI